VNAAWQEGEIVSAVNPFDGEATAVRLSLTLFNNVVNLVAGPRSQSFFGGIEGRVGLHFAA
jgi:hypothetical protein